MSSLRNRIAQMLIMGFDGDQVDETSLVKQWLSRDGLGGVLLFDKDCFTGLKDKNIKNPVQLKQLIDDLNACSQTHSSLPLLVGIDYEGGEVDRLKDMSGGLKTIPAIEQAKLSDDLLFKSALDMAKYLKSFGFNLNFAPVVDLNLNDTQGIIGKKGRSYSHHPEEVVRAAQIFVDAFRQEGMICSYKHFPGHGSAIGDTHEGFVDVTATFQMQEIEPYRLLLKESSHDIMIMTAHVINRQLDQSGLPATLSHTILTDFLRHQLGFQGVIISDDLQMHAITHGYSIDEALCLTINAGADMLIFGNQLGKITATEVIDRIESLVLADKIHAEKIEQAFSRILSLKETLHQG